MSDISAVSRRITRLPRAYDPERGSEAAEAVAGLTKVSPVDAATVNDK